MIINSINAFKYDEKKGGKECDKEQCAICLENICQNQRDLLIIFLIDNFFRSPDGGFSDSPIDKFSRWCNFRLVVPDGFPIRFSHSAYFRSVVAGTRPSVTNQACCFNDAVFLR